MFIMLITANRWTHTANYAWLELYMQEEEQLYSTGL